MLLFTLAVLSTTAVERLNLYPVEDTYIDAQYPDSNFGHDGLLVGGPKTAILIKFPGLDWIRPQESISTATLSLTLVEKTDVKLKSVKRLAVRWGEGPGLRVPISQSNSDAFLGGSSTWNSSRHGIAKWQSPGAGGERDSLDIKGVIATVDGDQLKLSGLETVLTQMAQRPSANNGLRLEFDSSVAFYSSDAPEHRPLFSLLTKPKATAPQLQVGIPVPTETGGWAATVKNTGDSPVTGWRAQWSFRGDLIAESSSQQALAPGDSTTITASPNLKVDPEQPRKNNLTLSVEAGGQGGASEEATVFANGLPIRFELTDAAKESVDKDRGSESLASYLSRLLNCTNAAVLAKSKSSFAPDGCWERLRLANASEPAVTVRGDLTALGQGSCFESLIRDVIRAASPLYGRWASPPDSPKWPDVSIGWIADTRDDAQWPTSLMMPQFPWGAPKPFQPPLPETGLLGRAEISAFNALAGKPVASRLAYVPNCAKTMILVIVDGAGFPINAADVQVFQTQNGLLATEAVCKTKSSQSGYALLNFESGKGAFNELKPDGSNSWMMVQVTKDFMTETAWVSATTLMSEAARGNSAAIVEVRMMLPSGALKIDQDLAEGKIVTDSIGRFPAELNALVDNNPATTLEVVPTEKPYSLEIDLGRDRLIGAVEIETTGKLWESFDISTSQTGQKAGEGDLWFREVAGAIRLADRAKVVGSNKVVSYSANAVRARYLRLVVRTGEKVNVAAIRVRTLQQ